MASQQHTNDEKRRVMLQMPKKESNITGILFRPLKKKRLSLSCCHLDHHEVYVLECSISPLIAVNATTSSTRTLGPFALAAAVFNFECRFRSFLLDREYRSFWRHSGRNPPSPPPPTYLPVGCGSSLHGRWRSASQRKTNVSPSDTSQLIPT